MPHSTRPNSEKYEKILEALRTLLENKKNIPDICQRNRPDSRDSKGSIYYYFSSKEAIFDALMAKSYEEPLATAKELAKRTDISPFVRMAMIFQACRNSSAAFLKNPVRCRKWCTGECIFAQQIHQLPDYRAKAGDR